MRSLYASFFFVLSLPALGADLDRDVQIHGFLSQGAAYTDQYRYGGASDDAGGYDLRELGVNLSLRPTPDWLLSAQVLARWAGEMDAGQARLDYGFVERTLVNTGADRVALALGKVKNAYGFYNSTRDVAHTRPGIVMPGVYSERIRDFFLAAPGASLRGEHGLGRVDLHWQANLVEMRGDSEEMEYFFTLNRQPGEFHGQRSWLGQVMADVDGGRWRIGVSLGDLAMDYRPVSGVFPEPGPGETRLRPRTLSLQHNREQLTLTAEYARVGVRNQGYGSALFDYRHEAEGWYAQAAWRFTPQWQAWVRRDESYFNRKDRDGSQLLAKLAGYGISAPGLAAMTYAKAWVLGLRYDLTQDLMLAAEWHRTDGLVDLSPRDNPAGFTRGSDWDMLLLQAAWRF